MRSIWFAGLLAWALVWSVPLPLPAIAQTVPLTVELRFDSQETIFPIPWREARIAAFAEPLPESRRTVCREMVLEELQKYPAGLLNDNVAAVYLLGRLGFRGVSASGTTSRENVYLAYKGKRSTFGDLWFRRVLHSEISSILFRNYARQFPTQRWHEVNPDDFEYGSGGVDAVKAGRTGEFFTEPLLELGFIGRYSQSSLENDFNAFAGQLLLGADELRRSADQHEAIRSKLDLTIEFYQSLDPQWNREYLLGLSQPTDGK